MLCIIKKTLRIIMKNKRQSFEKCLNNIKNKRVKGCTMSEWCFVCSQVRTPMKMFFPNVPRQLLQPMVVLPTGMWPSLCETEPLPESRRETFRNQNAQNSALSTLTGCATV